MSFCSLECRDRALNTYHKYVTVLRDFSFLRIPHVGLRFMCSNPVYDTHGYSKKLKKCFSCYYFRLIFIIFLFLQHFCTVLKLKLHYCCSLALFFFTQVRVWTYGHSGGVWSEHLPIPCHPPASQV